MAAFDMHYLLLHCLKFDLKMLKKLHVTLQVSVSFYKDRVNVCLHVHLYVKLPVSIRLHSFMMIDESQNSDFF